MFEFATQTIEDLRMNKRFYVDGATGHILWLDGDEFLCAPYGADGFVAFTEIIEIVEEETPVFPDLASDNCRIRAILLRRRGKHHEAEEWEAKGNYFARQARANPERCCWDIERKIEDYLQGIKKSS